MKYSSTTFVFVLHFFYVTVHLFLSFVIGEQWECEDHSMRIFCFLCVYTRGMYGVIVMENFTWDFIERERNVTWRERPRNVFLPGSPEQQKITGINKIQERCLFKNYIETFKNSNVNAIRDVFFAKNTLSRAHKQHKTLLLFLEFDVDGVLGSDDDRTNMIKRPRRGENPPPAHCRNASAFVLRVSQIN